MHCIRLFIESKAREIARGVKRVNKTADNIREDEQGLRTVCFNMPKLRVIHILLFSADYKEPNAPLAVTGRPRRVAKTG